MTTLRNTSVRFESVSMAFSRDEVKLAVDDVSFEAPPSAFTSIVGPSGCGKNALLKMAAGALRPSEGQVLVDQAPVRSIKPNVRLITQDSNLFPWLTLRKNVAFPLRLRHRMESHASRSSLRTRSPKVGLSGFADRYPYELSGGIQKRAIIARTLVCDPQIILMDEPFGSVDAITRLKLQTELLSLWEEGRKTILSRKRW